MYKLSIYRSSNNSLMVTGRKSVATESFIQQIFFQFLVCASTVLCSVLVNKTKIFAIMEGTF